MKELRLTDSSITVAPEEIFDHEDLERLYLTNNKFINLSSELANLVNLVQLDVSNNLLIEIPDAFNNLSKMHTFKAKGNKLKTIPSFKGCLALTYVDLSCNEIEDFSPIIDSDLNKLQNLELQHNEIREIPETVSKLSVVKTLDLQNNKITVVHGHLAECIKLKGKLSYVNLISKPLDIIEYCLPFLCYQIHII